MLWSVPESHTGARDYRGLSYLRRSKTMAVLEPRYSKEEFAQRGQTIYERDIRPHLGAGDDGKFVAIDIETGAYEIDRDDYAATERLLGRYPHAQIWLLRVGQRTAYRLGGRPGREIASDFRHTNCRIEGEFVQQWACDINLDD